MKQPEDTKTAELDLVAKRGRGRPALEHALTPAERAKRYRDSKRAAGVNPAKQHAQIKNHEGNPIPEITSKTYYDTLTAYHTARKEIEKLTADIKYAHEEAKTASALRTQLDFAEKERANAMTAYLAAMTANTTQAQKHKNEIENLTDDLKFANAEIKSIKATAKAEAKKARDQITLLMIELNKLRDASQK